MVTVLPNRAWGETPAIEEVMFEVLRITIASWQACQAITPLRSRPCSLPS